MIEGKTENLTIVRQSAGLRQVPEKNIKIILLQLYLFNMLALDHENQNFPENIRSEILLHLYHFNMR